MRVLSHSSNITFEFYEHKIDAAISIDIPNFKQHCDYILLQWGLSAKKRAGVEWFLRTSKKQCSTSILFSLLSK